MLKSMVVEYLLKSEANEGAKKHIKECNVFTVLLTLEIGMKHILKN